MTDQIVKEWLTDWIQIQETDDKDKILDYVNSLYGNEDLFQAITHVLEESERFRLLYDEIIATLFKFYRSSEKKLKYFTIQFIPSLIYVYLNQIHAQKKCVALETLLRGIYELECTAVEDKVPSSARIPNIHLPSIYHDPGGVSTTWLSDGELDRLTARTVKLVTREPLTFTEETVRAPQRLPLTTELWWMFNHRLPELPKYAIPTYLKTISKLISQGFNHSVSQRGQPQIRIILSSKLVIEMIQTIYFSVYNGAPTMAEQVLEETSNRANYQLWADAMLVCNAVQNYMKSSELPIQAEPTTFKKSIITNASFRTKKLPEDIPIVASDSVEGDSASNITTTETHQSHSSILAKSRSKLPHILAKMKRNSVVVINEEGDIETTCTSTHSHTPPERKKSSDATPV